ncbi:MAG: ribonuclease E/G, partial [Paracoccaceae bacterium]|nr:ribonuclease E/G [Paracoccaceae bacterium]
SIEETALKTNLEAAEEVARQLRLRDLAGLIVIDFIDMEERRNNASVEKRLKDKLKTDRARIQVGRISGFGLMEMSRQRLRPGMLESTTQPCAHCHGTGLIRSDDSLALQILRALEEEGTRKRSKEVLLRGPVAVVNFLMNQKREHIALIEARYGMSVRLEADPHLVSPDYVIEKFKTATRVVAEPSVLVISGNAGLMGAAVDEIEDEDIVDEIDEIEEQAEATAGSEAPGEAEANGNGDGNKKKRRRRRRRRGGATGEAQGDGAEGDDDTEADGEAETVVEVAAPVVTEPEASAEAAPKKPTRTRTRTAKPKVAEAVVAEVVETLAEVAEPTSEVAKPKASRSRTRKPKAAEPVADVAPADKPAPAPVVAPVSDPAPVAKAAPAPVAMLQPDPGPATATVLTADPAEAETPASDSGEPKPKRKGWWSLGR